MIPNAEVQPASFRERPEYQLGRTGEQRVATWLQSI